MSSKLPKKRRGSSDSMTFNGIAEMKDLISQMESFIKEAEFLATMEIRRAEEIKETLKATATRLGTQLKEKEDIIRTRESAMREMEEALTAKIQDLEKRVREKEAIPENREAVPQEPDSKTEAPNAPGEAPVPVEEKEAINLRDLEEGLLQRAHAGERGEEEPKDLEQRTAADTEAKGIKQSLRDIEVKPGRTVKRQVGREQKKSRLVSLLAPIKKRT